MDMDQRYVVVCEHTLGILRPGHSSVEALVSSPIKGCPYTVAPGNVPIPHDPSDIRNASLQDFEDFRLSPVGHLVDKAGNLL